MSNPSVRAGLLAAAAFAMTATAAQAVPRYHGFQGEGPGYVPFLDARVEKAEPLASQLEAAAAMPATIRWNIHGTPKVVFDRVGYLTGPRSGEPVEIARAYLLENAQLFGQSASMINAMEVLRVSPLHESPDYARMLRGEDVSTTDVPHVVLFRQVFDGVSAGGRDGLVTVGVARDGRVAFVGSTLTRDSALRGVESLSMVDALQIAAADVGMDLGTLELIPTPENDFNTFTSSILDDVQRVRPRALAIPGQGVRRVFEVTLLDSSHERGHPQAFITHLDAETGKVWLRDNAVQHFSDASVSAKATGGAFNGSTPPGECGAPDVIGVPAGNGLLQITATATSLEDPGAAAGAGPEPADITIGLFYNGTQVASQDLLGSPETLVYQPSGGVPAGDYEVVICPFNGSEAPAIDYEAFWSANESVPVAVPALVSPAWNVFPNSPTPNRFAADDSVVGEDTRENWCWEVNGDDPLDDDDLGRAPEQCSRELRNIGSRVAWDTLADGTPTFTTHGNNASTAVSNANFVAPDTVVLRPVAADRTYNFTFTDAWNQSNCDPTVFADPTRNFNDFEASTTNLFVMHNRMHDWSYMLGWTEVNSNLQFDNFGLTSPARENDGELGSAQAGRLTINGRDNANQITLQDGTPGITNQYLWQSLPGAIYAPGCVDGAYDMAIIGHEFTHATSNRMTGGPDASLGGAQAGSMGEAWSDLAAVEYLISYGLAPIGKERPFAMAVYATGDPEAGIRNYSIDDNPLTFADFDYDGNGAGSPHANSEIWGGTQYSVRQALVEKYQSRYPYEDQERQIACADGKVSSEACPGNRRWIQLLYDGMLLQPAAPTMLDARDAMLAADKLRYDGANQFEMWDAFAKRGMGAKAFATGGDDLQPLPDFASPLREDNARITFKFEGTDGSSPIAQAFVGHYEARVTPTVDNDPDTNRVGEVMSFVPGEYEFVVQANGYGLQRFKRTFTAGQDAEVVFPLRPNFASMHRGAIPTGDGDTPEDLLELIDDTEATNWASTDPTGTASEGKGEGAFVEGRQVTVQLAERTTVRDVQVSALQSGQNRFTALRSFDLYACDTADGDCAQDSDFELFYESPDDAFDGRWLRPKSPHLLLRSFDVPEVTATHVRIVVRDNQCTGGPDFQRESNPSGDPGNDPDCDTGSNLQLTALALPDSPANRGEQVYIAELQVFGENATEARTQELAAGERGSLLSGSRGGALGWFVLLLGLSPLLRRRWQR